MTRRVGRLALGGVAICAFLWAACALAFVKAPIAFKVVALSLLVCGPALTFARGARGPRFTATLLLAAALAGVAFALVPPSNDRAWWEEQARHPTGRREGDVLIVEGYRELRGDDEPIRYGTRRVDLSRLRRVWFGMEIFPGWEGGAHTFLGFEIEGEPFLGVSVESRREADEPFSAFRGLFRAYELVYVIGDEREVIGRRGGLGAAPAYLYPTRTDLAGRRDLLIDILDRSTRLSTHPEHYNTLTSNCTNNLAAHVNAVAPGSVSLFDTRVIFPGFSDRLLYERGMLDTAYGLEEEGDFRSFAAMREAFRIDGRVAGVAPEDFSAAVRGR